MKQIVLTRNKVTIVDDADYDWLMQWKWHTIQNGYAVTGKQVNKVRKRILMHRLIMNTSDDMQVDHINGNKLDNRRCNLRVCTASENQRNHGKHFGKNKYKGVWWHKNAEKWVAGITVSDKQLHLGTFDSEHNAATAYNMAALRHHREFARLNEIPYAS